MEYTIEDVFDLPNTAQGFTPEHLAETKVTLEVTLNVPRYKLYNSLSLTEKTELYKNIWETLKQTLPSKDVKSFYVIEYCRSGEPHLHGYFTFYTTQHIQGGLVMDFVKSYYKQLPKVYYKQISQHPYNEYYDRFCAPAICVNYKKILHINWETYIKKTHPNN